MMFNINSEIVQTLPLLGIFILCLIISSFLLKPINLLSNKALQRKSPIDGARGILALSVLVHHFYITYTWKTGIGWVPPSIRYLNNLGTMSVSFFFMITSYLFLSKINTISINWKKLFVSRFKRILPMYFFVFFIITGITLQTISTNSYSCEQFLYYIYKGLTFRMESFGGFYPSIVISHANWTLIYEWVFYFSLPLIYFLWQQKIPPIKLLIITICIAYVLIKHTRPDFYWLFFLALPSVILKQQINLFIQKYNHYLHIPMITLTGYILFFTAGYSTEQMLLLALLFSFIANGYSFMGILNIIALRKLGEISFSLYLTHGIYLYLFFTIFNLYDFSSANLEQYIYYFPLTYFTTLFSSILTYKFIEKPFLNN